MAPSIAEGINQRMNAFLVQYIDVDYSLWLTWLLTPLVITFLLPGIIVLMLYMNAIILYVYKLHWRRLWDTIGSGDRWAAARKIIAAVWDAHGWIWHGYEIEGMENIPLDEAALIVYYHGAIPIDLYYLLTKVYMVKNRMIHTVADYFLFKIPGFSIIAEGLSVIPGTIQTCSNILKEGNVLAISPGGVYESQFSQNYNLMWKKRLGFAKVAIEAKVPIIPMFTQNVRESFRTVSYGRKIFLRLYAWTKFPFAPIYGGFPVKMITYIGKPIPFDSSLSPEQLQAKVLSNLNELITKHQRIPGSILLGLLDRIPYFRKKNRKKENVEHEL